MDLGDSSSGRAVAQTEASQPGAQAWPYLSANTPSSHFGKFGGATGGDPGSTPSKMGPRPPEGPLVTRDGQRVVSVGTRPVAPLCIGRSPVQCRPGGFLTRMSSWLAAPMSCAQSHPSGSQQRAWGGGMLLGDNRLNFWRSVLEAGPRDTPTPDVTLAPGPFLRAVVKVLISYSKSTYRFQERRRGDRSPGELHTTLGPAPASPNQGVAPAEVHGDPHHSLTAPGHHGTSSQLSHGRLQFSVSQNARLIIVSFYFSHV